MKVDTTFYVMKQTIILCCIILGALAPTVAQSPPKVSSIQKLEIHSEVLNEKRNCLVHLPESYYAGKDTYPVLILLDGSIFFKTTAGIVHFMSATTNRNFMMPETIIVAIENVDRERDFTVTKIKTKRENRMGGGRNFLNFIENELLPYVDDHYRTEPHRTLIGHSLAGLLTINAYLDENSLFDAYVAIDPSLWWDEETMKSKVASVPRKSLPKKLFIATANQGESNYERNRKKHELFFTMLADNYGQSLHVKTAYFENEDHRSVPLKAIYEGLRYLNDDNQ